MARTERTVWGSLCRAVAALDAAACRRPRFSDAEIVLTLPWTRAAQRIGEVGRGPGRRGRGLRWRGVSDERRACVASTETPTATFAPSLLKQHKVIERIFARLEVRRNIGRPSFDVRTLAGVRILAKAALILDKFVQQRTASKTNETQLLRQGGRHMPLT